MNRESLDDKIGALRIEKRMLQKSMERVTDDTKIKAIEKRILEVNKEMKEEIENFKKEKEKNGRN